MVDFEGAVVGVGGERESRFFLSLFSSRPHSAEYSNVSFQLLYLIVQVSSQVLVFATLLLQIADVLFAFSNDQLRETLAIRARERTRKE